MPSRSTGKPPRGTGRTTKSTRFVVQDEGEDMDRTLVKENGEDEDGGVDASAMHALATMLKNTKSSASSRASVMEKTRTIIGNTRDALAAQRDEASETILKTIDNLEKTFASDPDPDDMIIPLAKAFGDRLQSVDALGAIYNNVFEKTAPEKDRTLDSITDTLDAQVHARAKSGAKSVRRARKALEEGYEYQKIAADAQDLIKHYKRLVKV